MTPITQGIIDAVARAMAQADGYNATQAVTYIPKNVVTFEGPRAVQVIERVETAPTFHLYRRAAESFLTHLGKEGLTLTAS